MADDSHVRYLQLYRAALTDDWDTAERIFQEDPAAETATINYSGQTTLHVAVGTNSSHRFVEKLIHRIAAKDKTKLRTPDYSDTNPLHYAAMVGNVKAARALIDKDPDMASIPNKVGQSVLKLAALYSRKETLVYLLGVTPNVVGEDGTSPYSGVAGGDLIAFTILSGFYDVALYLVEKYPKLAMEKGWRECTALQILAMEPSIFPSSQSWWFWQKFIYRWTPVSNKMPIDVNGCPALQTLATEPSAFPSGRSCWFRQKFYSFTPVADQEPAEKKPSNKCYDRASVKSILLWFRSVCFGFYLLVWKLAHTTVPFLRHIHDTKLVHKQTDQLMKVICATVFDLGEHIDALMMTGDAMLKASENGIHELVEVILGHYPGHMWYADVDKRCLYLVAIKYRQVKVYNLVHQMTGHVVFAHRGKNVMDNPLHPAGRKASPQRLETVTGAALQMQRELQWYKEVEKFGMPLDKESQNAEKKTPKMVFTDEHKDLVEKGEKWMKDTASSSMVVAALIVTVAFAAIFTSPGGNKDDGTPFFLRDSTFVLFAISDALALFSSVTSVLMFLAMLTSRYAEEDFLYALPKRLTIGLVSLFISIAAIMVTFSAALALVLRTELAWIVIPVGLIACVPVTFFALLQFPLLVELVLSTYGPSIFHKQNNTVLH